MCGVYVCVRVREGGEEVYTHTLPSVPEYSPHVPVNTNGF